MDLPSGTLTFLFTDIEGSTRLWEREPEAMQAAVARHDELLAEIVADHTGSVVKTTGDGMLAVFESAGEAAESALAIQRALRDEPWETAIGQLRVRAALHTDTAELRGSDYYGTAVNRAARLLSAGHGGQTLLSQSVQELLQDHLADATEMRFLGEYRLRDLSRPERVYQLIVPDLQADFPPLRTSSLRASNLPAELSSFVGRLQEMSEVERLLEGARLVTLTGPGGAGKTRLSLRVAARTAKHYADGVRFVALAATPDPELVSDTVAKALGVVEQPNVPLVESLGRYLSDKHMLLVLDNYEHVLAAALLVTELLAAAPRLSILVTSREMLHLSGEHEYPVPPLGIPDLARTGSLAELSAYESVILFMQRAEAVSPAFSLTEYNVQAIAAICARLDGLPLAIELAAARIKLFSPQQILERLENRLSLLTRGSRDLPDRHRTLRDTIDWSYNLLEKDERRLFTRLGVFRGGRSLEAVEAICVPGLDIEAFDVLESLLDKSLLRQEEGPGGEPRFIVLETIHEYARERLSQSGEEQQIRGRHLDYYVSLAERLEPGYRRHDQLLLIARSEAEMENLRFALDWAMESERFEEAARLVSALGYFLSYGDHSVEGYRWFKRVLDKVDEIPLERRAKLLVGAGKSAYDNGELSLSIHYQLEGLALARKLGDRRSEAWALIYGGGAMFGRPEKYEKAVKYCEEGLAIMEELDEKPGMAQAYNALGELARSAGNYARAREFYEACLEIVRETGEILRENMMFQNLSFVAYHEHEYERARDLGIAYMRQGYELGSMIGAVTGLASLAGPLTNLGEPEKAARLLGASAMLLSKMGAVHQPADLIEITRYKADVQAHLDAAAFEAALAEGETMTLDLAIAYALESNESVD